MTGAGNFLPLMYFKRFHGQRGLGNRALENNLFVLMFDSPQGSERPGFDKKRFDILRSGWN